MSAGGDCVDGSTAVTVKLGGAATPATTDGSQCSSSCSTVVIAGTTVEPITVSVLLLNIVFVVMIFAVINEAQCRT